jgi:hypothetical protein
LRAIGWSALTYATGKCAIKMMDVQRLIVQEFIQLFFVLVMKAVRLLVYLRP